MTIELALLLACVSVLVMAVLVNRRTKKYLDIIQEFEYPKTITVEGYRTPYDLED